MAIFMNYEGIEGDAIDANHEGWIEVQELRWSAHRRITSETSTRGNHESSSTQILDLHLCKYMDSSTPNLFIEACCGIGKTAVLHLTKTDTGLGAETYMEYTLSNALISEYKVGAGNRFYRRPREFITISFIDLELRYITYDNAGYLLPPVTVGFDTATNTRR